MGDHLHGQGPHDASNCVWVREKEYITTALEDLKDAIKSVDNKVDKYRDAVSDVVGQQKQVDALEDKMSVSREELSALRVKVSLLGVAAAAAVEVLFALAKHFQK